MRSTSPLVLLSLLGAEGVEARGTGVSVSISGSVSVTFPTSTSSTVAEAREPHVPVTGDVSVATVALLADTRMLSHRDKQQQVSSSQGESYATVYEPTHENAPPAPPPPQPV